MSPGAQTPQQRSLHSLLFSLRGRLLFLICLATLPAVLFTFFVAETERKAVVARAERDALHLARHASREHAHQIQGARELLVWLGAKLAREGRQSPLLADPDFLRALLAGHPQIANIGALSPEGDVLTSAYQLPTYRSWKDNPAYRAALHSDTVAAGAYIASPIFNRPTLNHACAVRDEAGQIIAVLFNGLDLEWLSRLAEQSDFPAGFALFITDQEGRVLARGGHGPAEHAEVPTHIPDIAALARGPHGRMVDTRGTGGRRYFVATALAQAPGLYVAAELPYERVLRQAVSAFYRTLLALGVLTLFIIAAVFMGAELGILRGLRSLARTAQRFGAGELAARASVPRGHDELTALARAFNTMAASLAARHREALEAQARLRALTQRLHRVREAEAARIARELHDELGQVLTSLRIDLSRLPGLCQAAQSPPCAAALRTTVDRLNQQIGATIDFVRHISAELRPGVLDKLGLTAALQWLARDVEARTNLAVQVEVDDPGGAPADIVAVTLFRITQEALTNVVRHAHASVVEISLGGTADELVLTIHDNGAGIVASAVESGASLGIIGMRERATLIHGRVAIYGVPGQGTTVRVTAPRTTPPEPDDAADSTR